MSEQDQSGATAPGARPEIVAAVTGTNGKSSVVAFARQIWTRLGHPAASLGTLGLVAPGIEVASKLTTPYPRDLRRCLSELHRRGVTRLALEASSIGLAEGRLDTTEVQIAAFTNFTREHLGYHRTMAAYFAAKMHLFRRVMAPGGTAVLNADVAAFNDIRAVCRERGHQVLSFGARKADIVLVTAEAHGEGQRLVIDCLGQRVEIVLPLPGRLQAENALCALGIVMASGGETVDAAKALANLEPLPGRLETVARLANGARIIVDYAHTPDALARALKAVRPVNRARLVLVFGCTGHRDPGKRQVMGEIASRLADRVIVTDDDPHTENPGAIRAAVLAGCPGAREIADRKTAIRTAVAKLAAGDVLVIAGKGHERTQKIGGREIPHNDAEVVREAAARLAEGAPPSRPPAHGGGAGPAPPGRGSAQAPL